MPQVGSLQSTPGKHAEILRLTSSAVPRVSPRQSSGISETGGGGTFAANTETSQLMANLCGLTTRVHPRRPLGELNSSITSNAAAVGCNAMVRRQNGPATLDLT